MDHRQSGYNTKLPKTNTLGRSCAFTRGGLLRSQVGSESANYIDSYVTGGMAVESLWVAVFLSVSLTDSFLHLLRGKRGDLLLSTAFAPEIFLIV